MYYCYVNLYCCVGTYDVQSIEVGRLPGAVRVTCNFATGSLARGCLVVITESGSDTNSTETWTGNAMRDDLNDQSAFYERDGFPEGMYDVTVFDIESDGSVASSPGQRGSVIVDPLSPGAMPSSITPSKAAIIAGECCDSLLPFSLLVPPPFYIHFPSTFFTRNLSAPYTCTTLRQFCYFHGIYT